MTNKTPENYYEELSILVKETLSSVRNKEEHSEELSNYGPAFLKDYNEHELDQLIEESFEKYIKLFNKFREIHYMEICDTGYPDQGNNDGVALDFLSFIQDIPQQANLKEFIEYADASQAASDIPELTSEKRIELATAATYAFKRAMLDNEDSEYDAVSHRLLIKDKLEERLTEYRAIHFHKSNDR